MRIAYLHYLQRADTASHHVNQFTEAARALGHEVVVHAMHPLHLAEGGAQSSGAAGRRMKARLRSELHELRELVRNLSYVPRELRVLRSRRPDVLLVRDHYLTASCVPVARLLGLPLVLEMNAPAAERHLYQDEYRHVPFLPDLLERSKLATARAVAVVSTPLRDHLVDRHGIPAEKFAVVPNGADVGRFRPDVMPEPAVRAWAGTDPVVGFVGSFQRWHGAPLLARLMLAVGRARPSCRFVLVGEGPELPGVRTELAELGERVRVVGRVSHQALPAIVAGFDVAVAPGCGFYMSPLKIVEWMAAGRAIVAPDHGGVRDLVDDGVEALLCPPMDVERFVAAVLQLVDDPARRRTMGAAAAARAHASLSWRQNAQRVVELCERAARATRTGSRERRSPSLAAKLDVRSRS